METMKNEDMSIEEKKKYIIHILSVAFYKIKEDVKKDNTNEFLLETSGEDLLFSVEVDGKIISLDIKHKKSKKASNMAQQALKDMALNSQHVKP